jgi:hypothetical protein
VITENDIKLLKSERMYDTDDGGGRMTGNEVVDGESNNMFPDVSELDRTYGRVNLRKVFPAVLTEDTDLYYGANVIISEPPSDPLVHASIFRTATSKAWFDERADAQDKVESYVAIGTLSPMRLIGNHYEGQRSVLAYQNLSDPLPGVGEVYALRRDSDGYTQYFRVMDVESRQVTYYDAQGSFDRLEVTITTSDPLRENFEGGEPSRYSSYQPPTKIHRTNVVEAVAYYGISPLAQAASFGDMTLRVERYKTPLVPSTQSESAMLDIPAGSVRTVTVSGGARSATVTQAAYTMSQVVSDQNRQYNYVAQLVPKPAPGTLEISYRSRDKWYTIYDEALDGSLSGDGAGTINYTTGSVSVTLQDLPDVNTAIVYAWGTGATYLQGTQGDVDLPQYRYTVAKPPINPSSVTITWDAGGEQKTATDDGAGNLTGDGTGYVLYGDGLVVFRPNSLPDPATTPVISYQGVSAPTQEDFQGVPVVNDEATVTLQAQPEAGSVRVKYTVRVRTENSTTPGFKVICQGETVATGQGPVKVPNGSTLEVVAVGPTELRIGMTSSASGELPFGSIDFVNKTVTVPTEVQYYAQHAVFEDKCTGEYLGKDAMGFSKWSVSCSMVFDHYEWDSTTSASTADATIDVNVDYVPQGTTYEAQEENIPSQNLLVRLQPTSNAMVVPGTVQFQLAGHTFIDIEGDIHMDPDAQTGVGTPAGSIDYQTGDVTLTYWVAGAFSFTLQSLLLEVSPRLDNALTWRTVAAPVRPASLTLAVTAEDGTLITASADLDGNVTGDYVEGGIEEQTGVVSVRFGEYRLASELTEEEKAGWFRQEDVLPDGTVWVPKRVLPNTARYNVVVYVYLPLSEDILGLDPVRLPMDGRVPIFRVGDVVVVHHTQQTAISSPTNGQVVNTGRVRLAYARLYDANGDPVPTDRYTVDLDAGTVTLVDVSGLATPLTLEDRIEDMALVSDLQINGTLTLTRALSHDFPVGSYVSSALVIGDMFARVGVVFSQATWTGEWSDTRIGSDTTGKYNDTLYPILVTNKGCIQERWAIIFTGSATFKLVGEYTGQIATGDINTDFSPINPETGVPYFTIRAGGWGTGWATGNVLRINTIAANYPVWVVRTILQGDASAGEDRFRICVRGDVNTP